MILRTFLWYLLAAIGEIGGCFAFWAWLRLGRSPLQAASLAAGPALP
jgi:small multidrug resistance family-3 protein